LHRRGSRKCSCKLLWLRWSNSTAWRVGLPDNLVPVPSLVGLCLLSTALLAQQTQKRIFLSPKSNITTAEVAEGFSKHGPTVVLTQNEAKADYILEAAETLSADEGTANYARGSIKLNSDFTRFSRFTSAAARQYHSGLVHRVRCGDILDSTLVVTPG
jgi:hypothetical protein